MESPSDRRHAGLNAQMDWTGWEPDVRATLLFVFDGERVLLIRKKTGLGAGKINAAGGKIEPGETAADGAIRELREEVGVQVDAAEHCGELSFQFTDGLRLHVQVFRADRHRGQPVETEEARPLWFPVDAIPYDEMWADDRVWVPHLLARRRFVLRAVFDGDDMLEHELDLG